MIEQTLQPSDVLNVDDLIAHVGHDLDLLAELVEMFRDYYPAQMEQIESAIHDENHSQIREIAHQFKGALSNFHAPKSVEAARQLEFAGRDRDLESAQKEFATLQIEIERTCEALAGMTSK